MSVSRPPLPPPRRVELALDIAWQPICTSVGAPPLAHEALLRLPGDETVSPRQLLLRAERGRWVADLERAAHRRIALQLRRPGPGGVAFVNLHARSVVSGWFFRSDAPLVPFADRVVFELPATPIPASPEAVSRQVQRMRALGFGVAVTDLGSRRTTLQRAMVVRPDVIKIRPADPRDGDAEDHPAYVERVLRFAEVRGIDVVAECVETRAQHRTLLAQGVRRFQGFAFGRPRIGALPAGNARPVAVAS